MDDPSIEVKIVLRNGNVRDLPNLPAGVSVHIYDYDLDKYPKDRQEPDPEGKPCAATIWSRYPTDKHGKTVYAIRHTLRVEIKRGKVSVTKCPKEVTVTFINEDSGKRK